MLWGLISAWEWKDVALNTPGTERGKSEIGWIHPTFTLMVFCALSFWEILDLPACWQILVHPSMGGWMKGGENWETILCCGQRKKGRAVTCQMRNTQSGFKGCTFCSAHSWSGPSMVMCIQNPHNFTGAIFKLCLVLLYDVPVSFLLSQSSASFLTTCTLPRLQFPYPFACMFFILLVAFSPFKVQVYLVTHIILHDLMPPSPIFLAELCSVVHSSRTPNLLCVQWFRLAKTASDYCRLWDIGCRIS